MFIASAAYVRDVLAAVIASVLNTSAPAHTTVKLAKAVMTLGANAEPTTFTEADFTGYASKSITGWTAPYQTTPSVAETVPTVTLQWSPTGTGVTNTIYGYWLIAGDGTYVGGENFATPVPLTGPTTALNLVIPIQSPPCVQSAYVIA